MILGAVLSFLLWKHSLWTQSFLCAHYIYMYIYWYFSVKWFFSFIINTVILIPDYYCFHNKYTFKLFFIYALFYNHMKSSYLDSVMFCVLLMCAASLFILLWFLFLFFSWLTCIYIFFRKEMYMMIVLSSHILDCSLLSPYENLSIVGCRHYGSQTLSPYNGGFFFQIEIE